MVPGAVQSTSFVSSKSGRRHQFNPPGLNSLVKPEGGWDWWRCSYFNRQIQYARGITSARTRNPERRSNNKTVLARSSQAGGLITSAVIKPSPLSAATTTWSHRTPTHCYSALAFLGPAASGPAKGRSSALSRRAPTARRVIIFHINFWVRHLLLDVNSCTAPAHLVHLVLEYLEVV